MPPPLRGVADMKIEVDAHDLHRMILLLDAAEDALNTAAAAEKKREQGKPLRQVTAQQRAAVTRQEVAAMPAKYDVDLT